jgi:hypothetical protein
LKIPLGEMIEYVHVGYGSMFSKYLIISVENGVCGEQNIVKDEEGDEPIEDGRQQELPHRQNNIEKRPTIKSIILNPSAFALGL